MQNWEYPILHFAIHLSYEGHVPEILQQDGMRLHQFIRDYFSHAIMLYQSHFSLQCSFCELPTDRVGCCLSFVSIAKMMCKASEEKR
jgi:hypothetical protein